MLDTTNSRFAQRTLLSDEARKSPARLAQVVPRTRAEGPGERFAIWFQGCPFRCPECCNPEMLSFEGGQLVTVGNVIDQMETAQSQCPELEGITLLGGEPFAHAAAGRWIARGAKQLGLSVMIFSGYRLEELECDSSEDVKDLLAQMDLLIDGLYEKDQPDHHRRWIGSTNQRIHCLTDRYSLDDPFWREPNTLEIRMDHGAVTINGFPARSAVGLWKRLGN